MHVRCPHCHNPIEVVEDTSFAEILCPSCGSSFSLISGETTKMHYTGTRRLAHFELVRELGIGKFGSVWMARDTKLDRTVAIKIPRQGALDTQETELFLRDARAAAQLKHPGIVSVHEIGRDHDTVYIVSDYVEGANLKEWLSCQRLSFRESAEMVVRIAEALHHAHEAGVVHRDLKPGNVMIDLDGQPHVIDFGLARREAGEITMTVEGHILGTPAYMSPEQAKGKGHQADRRSDVYSLGVILFELLTGELPFRGEAQMLLLQIQRDEPPRPRRLNNKIPHDLQTITLKCLQKEPAKRYAMAQALSDDLNHWLNGEPIVARPIGRVARSWRWCKRNRAVASWAAAAAIALAAGTLLSTYFAISANQRAQEATVERRRAEANLVEATRQQKLAAENLEIAAQQRLQAEEGNRRARQAVDEYYTRVSQSKLLDEPRLLPLRKDLLEAAMTYYRDFISERRDDPAIRAEVAAACFRLADVMNAVGDSNWPQPAKQGIELLEALVKENAGLADLGSLADGVYRNRSQELRFDKKNAQELLHMFQRLRAVFEEFVRRFPSMPGFRNDLAGAHHVIGILYMDGLGQPMKAMVAFRASRDQWKILADTNPGVAEFRLGLSGAHGMSGLMYGGAGLHKSAIAEFKQAITILEPMVQANPHATAFKQSLALWQANLGHAQRSAGLHSDASDTFRHLAELEKLWLRDDPLNLELQGHYWRHAAALADLLYQRGDFAAAEPFYRDSWEIVQGMSRKGMPMAGWPGAISIQLANCLAKQGKSDDAEQMYKEVVKSESRYWPVEGVKVWAEFRKQRGLAIDDAYRQSLALMRESLARDDSPDAGDRVRTDVFRHIVFLYASTLAAREAWPETEKLYSDALPLMRARGNELQIASIDAALMGVQQRMRWKVDFYRIDSAKNMQLPQDWQAVVAEAPLGTTNAPVINFDPGTGGLPQGIGANFFGTVATATVELPEGEWEVTTVSDDGIRLLIDDQKVIDHWDFHHAADHARARLASGPHRIRLEHFQWDGHYELRFGMRLIKPAAASTTGEPVKP